MPETTKPFRCVLCGKDIRGQSRALHDKEDHPGLMPRVGQTYANAGNDGGKKSGWRKMLAARFESQKRRGAKT